MALVMTGSPAYVTGEIPPGTCPGPFIWYPASQGAVLLCATCRHLTVTGNWNQPEHAYTPILTEGLA